MSNNYTTIKIKKDALNLLPEAKKVFNSHNKNIEGINLTNSFIIKRALEYYIEH